MSVTMAVRRFLLLAVTFVTSFLVVPAIAGGLQVGVLQVQAPSAPDERKVVALVINDLMPVSLERAFNERYGVLPVVRSIPISQAPKLDVFIKRAKNEHLFDILVVPETRQLGSQTVVQLRVLDLRSDSLESQERSFTAIIEGPSLKGIDSALTNSAERIAAAVFGRSSLSWSPERANKMEGPVYVWCIIPETEKDNQDIIAGLLTINLASWLSLVSKDGEQKLTFFGLGPRDYFNECRNRSSGRETSGAGIKKAPEATYALSGQMLSSSDKETWLRLFVEDRSIGQTVSIQPIRVLGVGEDKNSEAIIKALVTRHKEISRDIFDNFVSAVQRKP